MQRTAQNPTGDHQGPDRATLLASLAFLLLSLQVALAQCETWPDGCPGLEDLWVADPDNIPISVSPGHTPEEFCPSELNDNLELQLDLTSTYVAFDAAGLLYLRSFYNNLSAASTTEQFWFFDIDNNPLTGGHDAVRPHYVNAGNASAIGPAPCATPRCSLEYLSEEHASGFEYYIHSYGQSARDYAIFWWDGLQWQELPPVPGVVNLQGSEDDPANPYPGLNGFRGLAYLPREVIGITDGFLTLSVRSWSCLECCGDNSGGEGIVLQPGMVPCRTSICGDCDANGFVNILDAHLAARYDAGLATLGARQFSNCNVAGAPNPSLTNDVSILDALTIARYVVGQEILHCCTPDQED